MAIQLDIAANTRDFQRGVQDVDKALDKVADSLDDVAKDGDKATEKLERSFKDLADSAKDSGRDIGRGMDDGFDKAKDGAEEFKDEANSTAREAAASFDGSAESIGEALQEVAANAFAGFGPVGAAAGLAAAAGIGLAAAGFETVQEAEEESKQAAADWAEAYIDAGSRILDATQVVEKARDIITDPEQYKEAQDNAREWGVTESVAILAMAGDTNALTEASEKLRLKKRELNDTPISERTSEEMLTLMNDVRNGEEALNKLTDAQAQGGIQADIYSESLRLLAENTAGTTSVVDEFGDTVYTLPDGKQIYIDAQTGKATENVDAIEKKVFSMTTNKTIKIDADTTGVEGALRGLQGRTISVNVQGQVTRIGNQVW